MVGPLRLGGWRAAPILIYLLLAAEGFLFTYGRSILGDYVSPVVLYLCGLGASFGVYRFTRHRGWPAAGERPGGAGVPQRRWALAVAVALGLGWCLPQYAHIVHSTIAQDVSDILMALTVYPQRWLAGQEVYQPLTAELGYFALPTYLPATWFPFVLPEWLHFDYRWMSGAVFLVGVAAYLWTVYRQRLPAGRTFALALLPFGLTYAVLATELGLVGWTVELLIVGYYLLLVVSVLQRSYWGQAVMLTICLLSRFSLVFWVPLYLGLLFWQGSRRAALWVSGGIVAGIVLLYIIPFLSHDWSLFIRVQHAYTDVALGEWNRLNGQGQPWHLYNGIGLGNFIYRFGSGPLLARLHALQLLHLTLLLVVVAAAALVYWRQRGPRSDFRVYAVVVLKVYLITFYAFIQVPYAYLATVGLFMSLFLVLIVARYPPAAAEAEAVVAT